MRRQFLLASVVLVVLVVPAVASAATRYASPNGSSSASCTAAAPCDLVTAVNGDGLNNNPTAGDEVVITPGQYGQLGNGIHTRLDPAAQENIHGAAGQPPPVLQLDAAPSGQVRSVIVLDQPDDRLADVDINTPYSGFEVPNGTVDGVFARSFSDVGDHACGLAQSITNTVCFRDGQGGGSAFRAAFSGCPANTSIALRNVTLEAPQGTGADVSAFGATCNPTVTISNAVIRGSPATQLDPAQDLLAYSSGGGGSVSVVLDHSDYTQTNAGPAGPTT